MQMAGPSALATDDIMEVMRSVLAQVLPVTYSDVDPQAYKNVTVCPIVAPAPAPLPAQQNPGTPGQASGRRRLQVGKLDGSCQRPCMFSQGCQMCRFMEAMNPGEAITLGASHGQLFSLTASNTFPSP